MNLNLDEAKAKMKSNRALIRIEKQNRIEISGRIAQLDNEIRSIKGAIFRGEIK